MLLACDPGYNNYGCSVIDQYGTVIDVGTIQTAKTKNKLNRVADDDIRRITYITEQLSKVIRHYDVKGVLSELPPSGGQSAIAVKGLAMAVALSTALFTSFGLPIEWATPAEVKKAIAGKENASKEDIMLAVCKKYGWKITEKPVYSKTTKKVQRIDKTYHPIGKSIGKNLFEHIADSLGAFEALKHTNTARMFLKKQAA